jgi:hypothetical protein
MCQVLSNVIYISKSHAKRSTQPHRSNKGPSNCCNEKCRRLLLSTMECGHSYIHCKTGNQAAARPVVLSVPRPEPYISLKHRSCGVSEVHERIRNTNNAPGPSRRPAARATRIIKSRLQTLHKARRGLQRCGQRRSCIAASRSKDRVEEEERNECCLHLGRLSPN